MSPVILKKQFSNSVLNYLFKHFINSHLNSTDTYEKFLVSAKELVEKTDSIQKNKISEERLFISPDMFEIKHKDHYSRVELFFGFNNFCKAVYDVMTNSDVKRYHNELKGVPRKDVPNLVDFDYVGNNDFKNSNRLPNYSLLF